MLQKNGRVLPGLRKALLEVVSIMVFSAKFEYVWRTK